MSKELESGDNEKSDVLMDTVEKDVNKMAEYTDVGASAETRNYHLNPSVAMKKKLKASSEDLLQIKETDGGVTLKMNAGMYELFKYEAKEYLQSCNRDGTCKITDVYDKSKNIIETRYRVSLRHSGQYTLNMYHTSSSCLVNGRNTSKFLDTDLPNILTKINQNLTRENCSINDFNSSVRDMIVHYFEYESTGTEHAQDAEQIEMSAQDMSPTDDTTITETPLRISTKNMCCLTEATQTTTLQTQSNQSTQTEIDIFDLIKTVHTELVQFKQTMTDYIVSTNNKFDRIRDEMVQVKKQMSVSHSHIDRTLEELDCKQSTMQSTVQKAQDIIQKRLQGVFDSLKSIHTKNQAATHYACRAQNGTLPQQPSDREIKTPTRPPRVLSNSPRSSGCLNSNTAIRSTTEQTSRRSSKKKTLIIGSSITRGIHPRGLDANVDTRTCPGAIIPDIGQELSRIDMRTYSNVIIYVGGNDVSRGLHIGASRTELLRLTHYVQRLQCNLYICTVAPRRDADVRQYNTMVREVCRETGATLIDTYSSYVYGDGNVVRHYFTRDGIHHSGLGSRTLVTVINQHLQIVKRAGHSASREMRIGHTTLTEHISVDGFSGHSPQSSGRTRHGAALVNVQRRFCRQCNLSNHDTRDCRRRLW